MGVRKMLGAVKEVFVKPKPYRRRSSALEPELKFFDTAVSFTADATNEIPATGQLSLIPQGDTQSNREGRKAVVKSIQCSGLVNFTPGAGATASDILTMWIVQDTQCNGAAATVADDNSGIFIGTGANASVAVRCLANSDRFRILKKWTIPLVASAGVTTAYNNVSKPVEMYKKCNIPIEYDASVTTGALTSIRSNNIFLVAGTAGGSDDTITCSMTARLRFVG